MAFEKRNLLKALVLLVGGGIFLKFYVLDSNPDRPSGYASELARGIPAADLRRLMRESDSGIFRAIETHLPDEFEPMVAAMVRDLADIDNRAPDMAKMMAAMMGPVEALHAKYFPTLAQAPDATLKAVVERDLAAQRAVEAAYGAEFCARYARLGNAVFGQTLPKEQVRAALEAQVDGLIEAYGAAKADPVQHGPATDDDKRAMLAANSAAGATPERLAEMVAADGADPETCALINAMMEGVLSLEGAGGARIRAEFIQAQGQ